MLVSTTPRLGRGSRVRRAAAPTPRTGLRRAAHSSTPHYSRERRAGMGGGLRPAECEIQLVLPSQLLQIIKGYTSAPPNRRIKPVMDSRAGPPSKSEQHMSCSAQVEQDEIARMASRLDSAEVPSLFRDRTCGRVPAAYTGFGRIEMRTSPSRSVRRPTVDSINSSSRAAWRKGRSDRVNRDLNPWTGEVLTVIAQAMRDDLDEAYAAAKQANPDGPRCCPAHAPRPSWKLATTTSTPSSSPDAGALPAFLQRRRRDGLRPQLDRCA